jgi:hypothetical protein
MKKFLLLNSATYGILRHYWVARHRFYISTPSGLTVNDNEIYRFIYTLTGIGFDRWRALQSKFGIAVRWTDHCFFLVISASSLITLTHLEVIHVFRPVRNDGQ